MVHLFTRRSAPARSKAPLMLATLIISTTILASTAAPVSARHGNHHVSPSQTQMNEYQRGQDTAGSNYDRGDRGRRFGHAGVGLGAGLAGLAFGSMMSDAAEVATDRVDFEEAVAYCSARFRSYDPATSTYLGYDGNERACP